MIFYKTNEEIELIRESSLLVAMTLAEVAKNIKPGIKTIELDTLAEEFIKDNNAYPAFKGYNGFPYTLCTSVNSAVVHGIPSEYELREGDLVSVDCGVLKNQFYGDSAFTFPVGKISEKKYTLLKVTRECLKIGIEKAILGNRIGDISDAIQTHAEFNNFSVVRELVGHGIGKELHESPEVPNYGKKSKGLVLKEGLVIAIEPMINMGRKEVFRQNDNWTIRTVDDMPSAHFEHTIAIKRNGVEYLSSFEYIDEVLKFNLN